MLKHLKNREDWSEKNVAQKGFTLIELLVVIAVLGILAVVGVLAFGGITGSAKTAVNNTEKAEVNTAARAFEAQSGTPATTADYETQLAAYVKVAELKCDYTFAAGQVATQTGCPA